MKLPTSIPASFIRGGTSKGVFLNQRDLPADQAIWPHIFRKIMGSPCPHGRQLNGLGGGTSSTSKICVVDAASTGRVYLTFAQVGVTDESIDMHGTCGNLMSAVPLFALEQGLLQLSGTGRKSVTVHDINTGKDINTSFQLHDGRINWSEEYEIAGVSGHGVKVDCEYTNCGGTKTGKLYPTGQHTDTISLTEGSQVPATLIDGPNPAVLVAAKDLGLDLDDTGWQKDPSIMNKLEEIRLLGTVKMGIASSLAAAKDFRAIPKISLLQEAPSTDQRTVRATTLSMEQPHRAIPITIALSLAIAMATPGTIAHSLSSQGHGMRILHPTGHVDVDANLNTTQGITASVSRSVRKLMTGQVWL